MKIEAVDLRYVPIIGRGVDALENRKETGSPVEVTEAQMRLSIGKVASRNCEAFKQLRAAARTRLQP